MRIYNVETHTGVSLNGTVTTNVTIGAPHFCEIDWERVDKQVVGFRVKHTVNLHGKPSTKHFCIPFTQVKQWNLEADADEQTTRSAKAS